SGPMISFRSSANVPGAAPVSGPSSGDRTAASVARRVLGARQLELIVEPHGHLGEQRRKTGTVRFVHPQLVRLTHEARDDLVHLEAELLHEPLLLIVELLPRIPEPPRHLIVEVRRSLRDSTSRCIAASMAAMRFFTLRADRSFPLRGR